jgi:hypothetical protein
MHRPLFLRILRAVQQEDDYFTIRCDATGLAGEVGSSSWPCLWLGS